MYLLPFTAILFDFFKQVISHTLSPLNGIELRLITIDVTCGLSNKATEQNVFFFYNLVSRISFCNKKRNWSHNRNEWSLATDY